VTSGRTFSGSVELIALLGGDSTTQTINVVNEISDDAWNFNTAVNSGAISLAINSQTIKQSGSATTSAFLLNTGPVAD